MKIQNLFKTLTLIGLAMSLTFINTSCKKEGCTDEKATNYDADAKKDDGSCQLPNEEKDYDVTGLTEIGRNYSSGSELVLYAKEELYVGYNYLYILTLDSATGDHLNDGHLTLMPMMDMGMHKHGAPAVNPSSESPTMKGLYEAQIGFQMGSMGGSWTIELEYHRHGGEMAMIKIPVNVKESGNRLVTSFIDSNSVNNDKVFLMYALPEKPTVGLNDFEVFAFYKKDMMTWPALTDLTLEMEPSMPSMGHGSPNNVNPVHGANGMYNGKVNYTMTGLWKIDMKVKRNGISVSDDHTYFEYTL